MVDALLAAREAHAVISRGQGRPRFSVEEYVAYWLRELGLVERFSVEPIQEGGNLFQVWVRTQTDGPRVLLTDVGFGVSQILPVLTLCYYAPQGSVLILEQPEIHLHPAVQAGLADVFVDAVKRRGIQIILESHSEHLLQRLQRRLAEEYQVSGTREPLTAGDVALYFCDRQDGESRLIELDLDEYGNIRNWPRDFFGDPLGEAAARTEAAMRRRLKEQDRGGHR